MPLWAALVCIVVAYFLGAYVEAWRTLKRVARAYQDGKIASVKRNVTS
jgi:hypothetical protein